MARPVPSVKYRGLTGLTLSGPAKPGCVTVIAAGPAIPPNTAMTVVCPSPTAETRPVRSPVLTTVATPGASVAEATWPGTGSVFSSSTVAGRRTVAAGADV